MSKIIGPNLVTSGLVLHLDAANPKSYQSGSTSWFDMSGNNNNGILVSGSGYSSANFGSITFDGVDDYINLGNRFNFEYNTSFTICGWFYFNNDNDMALVSKEDDTANYRGWILRKLSNYQLMFGLVNNTNNQIQVRSQTLLMTNNLWYYLCGTYTGNSLASGVNLYMNGSSITTSVVNNNLLSNTIITNANVSIGSFGLSLINNPMNGRNSMCQIYNRALSPSEVLQNFNATRGRYGI